MHAQPDGQEATEQALLALQACPVAAIETNRSLRSTTPVDGFPALIKEHPQGKVYYCGWASRRSFGACSWLIIQPSGNVMVDVPRWSAPLARRIKAMGGLRFIVLTHRDDVADHERWARTFCCDRWIHAADADAAPQAEQLINGGDAVPIADPRARRDRPLLTDEIPSPVKPLGYEPPQRFYDEVSPGHWVQRVDPAISAAA